MLHCNLICAATSAATWHHGLARRLLQNHIRSTTHALGGLSSAAVHACRCFGLFDGPKGAESTPVYGCLRTRPTSVLAKRLNSEAYRTLPAESHAPPSAHAGTCGPGQRTIHFQKPAKRPRTAAAAGGDEAAGDCAESHATAETSGVTHREERAAAAAVTDSGGDTAEKAPAGQTGSNAGSKTGSASGRKGGASPRSGVKAKQDTARGKAPGQKGIAQFLKGGIAYQSP